MSDNKYYVKRCERLPSTASKAAVGRIHGHLIDEFNAAGYCADHIL